MCNVDTELVKLASYQLEVVSRIWYDQWKKNRAEGAPILSWVVFENAFLGCFFPGELREAMVREFLNVKQEAMSVQEYNLKFTQLSRYASKIVADMISRMSLFVSRLSIYRVRKSQGSVAQGATLTPTCAKCCRNHLGAYRNGSNGFFKCGQMGNFREYPKDMQGNVGTRAQSSSYELLQGQANKQTISMTFGISPDQFLEPFSVSTHVSESILAERVYRDSTICVYHKDTMDELFELEMVDFDVILSMDLLHACSASTECRT
ncbi:hypothetical protein MTR67_048181 [Solanum verrucosum]|uniref:Retrotransposon gag domain-containing protein n=1 Tax=Solanum verrucosum TaxID=315347 RepID=A0AAF0ZX47_SOLVR|nr:hypothetical protein MTR67_048181 [Solanum verrucosum]